MPRFRASFLFAALATGTLLPASSCGGDRGGAAPERDVSSETAAARDANGANHSDELEFDLAKELMNDEATARLLEPWAGDLDGMVERGYIRVLVTYNRTSYFLDEGEERGLTHEALRLFERELNEKLRDREIKLQVIGVPVSRDVLIPWIAEGRGDIAAANLTITPERERLVDFSRPFLSGVQELVVTGPGGPRLASLEDLSGHQVHVRVSSSFFEHLTRLNERFRTEGRTPIDIVEADELLESEDLLEMVSAGVIPATVVDSHIGELWAQVFDNLTLNHELAVNTGGQIAWAFRKESPALREVVDEFARTHGKGTLVGNVLFNRYLREAEFVRNPGDEEDQRRFEAAVDFFQTYGEMYDLPYLVIAAVAYQESGIDQSRRSPAGAIGVMQLLRSTAGDRRVAISGIERIEPNIHAGVKYLRVLVDMYFDEPEIDPLNQYLFAIASYNAGPARVSGLRRRTAELGLDPNQWFQNVEVVAAREIGRETVTYVRNIYKYYVAYRLIVSGYERKQQFRGADGAG